MTFAHPDLADGQPVTLINPLWAALPVYHDVEWIWDERPRPPALEREMAKEGAYEGDWRFNAVTTHCGILLRANWWLEPPDHGKATHDSTFRHPSSVVDLRFDHARKFARPCRRCWPSTPPQT